MNYTSSILLRSKIMIMRNSHNKLSSPSNKIFNLIMGHDKKSFSSMINIDKFPSLKITKNELIPQGAFAQMQAEFLKPDQDLVHELYMKLKENKIGIVAHFYMDPELQGTLHAIKQLQLQDSSSSSSNHNNNNNNNNNNTDDGTSSMVHISDSLVMGDKAVEMVTSGQCKSIICLGVDFMSESVRAILDFNHFHNIPVYRLSSKKIGCSLAEAAERVEYFYWLKKAREIDFPDSDLLHVIYINTSLLTKSKSHEIIPTITVTSSNVLQTILQVTSQNPNLKIFYGPDTYMGENLYTMLQFFESHYTDDEISHFLHPMHNRKSLKKLIDENFHYFKQGNCIVHHMFGHEVCGKIHKNYLESKEKENVFITAHLEVPGEMFSIAMKQSVNGRGVVGSTSNILNFIIEKTKNHMINNNNDDDIDKKNNKLSFILGTEAGMVTSIVKAIQKELNLNPNENNNNTEVEIIFPVSSDAVAVMDNNSSIRNNDLQIIPGVQSGEGCSISGGCAECPYMKMNTLESLTDVIDLIGLEENNKLLEFLPPKRSEVYNMDLGIVPIQHMRYLQKTGIVSDDLLNDISKREILVIEKFD